MTYKIESINETDIEALAELFAGVGPFVAARTLSDYWLYARLFGSTCLCVRSNDGQPIAAMIAFRDQSEDRREIYVQDVAVHSDSRRRGLGEALLEDLRCRAQRWSVRRIWLTSEVANTSAMNLWTKLGYVNKQADYESDGVWLTKDLKGPSRDRAVYELGLAES
jgi:ribosomal protein S18 acetylase RimI-like enzyme